MQLLVGQSPDFSWFAFPNYGGFISSRSIQMPIQAIFRDVQFAANEPLGEGSFPFQHGVPFFLPEKEFSRLFVPEPLRILDRLLVKLLVLFQARNQRVLHEPIGWLKDPRFYQVRLNRIAHGEEGFLGYQKMAVKTWIRKGEGRSDFHNRNGIA